MKFADSNQTVLYDWTLQCLRRLKPDGELFVPDLSPLTTDQIVEVLTAVGEHQVFRNQTVSVPAQTGVRSVMKRIDGVLVIESKHVDEPHPQVMPYGAGVFINTDEGKE